MRRAGVRGGVCCISLLVGIAILFDCIALGTDGWFEVESMSHTILDASIKQHFSVHGRVNAATDINGQTATAFYNLWNGQYGLNNVNTTGGDTCNSFNRKGDAMEWFYNALCTYAVPTFVLVVFSLFLGILALPLLLCLSCKGGSFLLGIIFMLLFLASLSQLAALIVYGKGVSSSFDSSFGSPLGYAFSTVIQWLGFHTTSNLGYSYILAAVADALFFICWIALLFAKSGVDRRRSGHPLTDQFNQLP